MTQHQLTECGPMIPSGLEMQSTVLATLQRFYAEALPSPRGNWLAHVPSSEADPSSNAGVHPPIHYADGVDNMEVDMDMDMDMDMDLDMDLDMILGCQYSA